MVRSVSITITISEDANGSPGQSKEEPGDLVPSDVISYLQCNAE